MSRSEVFYIPQERHFGYFVHTLVSTRNTSWQRSRYDDPKMASLINNKAIIADGNVVLTFWHFQIETLDPDYTTVGVV